MQTRLIGSNKRSARSAIALVGKWIHVKRIEQGIPGLSSDSKIQRQNAWTWIAGFAAGEGDPRSALRPGMMRLQRWTGWLDSKANGTKTFAVKRSSENDSNLLIIIILWTEILLPECKHDAGFVHILLHGFGLAPPLAQIPRIHLPLLIWKIKEKDWRKTGSRKREPDQGNKPLARLRYPYNGASPISAMVFRQICNDDGNTKLPEDDLFLLDKEYVEQQKFRRYLLKEKREGVMQCLPGSEDACAETLDYVVNFLTKKYPRLFVPVPEKPGYLHNCITDLTFKISKCHFQPHVTCI